MIDKIKNYTSVNKYDIQLLDNIYNVLNKIDFQYLDKYKIFLDKAKKMHSICNEKSKFLIPIEDYCTNELMKIIEDAVVKSDTVKIKYNDLTGEVINIMLQHIVNWEMILGILKLIELKKSNNKDNIFQFAMLLYKKGVKNIK